MSVFDEVLGDGQDGFGQCARDPLNITAQVALGCFGGLAAPAQHKKAHTLSSFVHNEKYHLFSYKILLVLWLVSNMKPVALPNTEQKWLLLLLLRKYLNLQC